MTDVIRPCVLSNGDDGMPCRRHPTVCTVEKVIMAFNARRRPTMCDAQGR